MSLLEAPCAKTSWRALLLRAILAITGALIVCFDIWRFKEVTNSETGFGGHHCDFEQHVPYLTACVYEFRQVRIRGAWCFYFVGALLFRDNVQTHLGDASIREGASNRDITVCVWVPVSIYAVGVWQGPMEEQRLYHI